MVKVYLDLVQSVPGVEAVMAYVLQELLLYCCLAAFVTGIVLAAATLISLRKLLSFMPTLLANSSAWSVQVFASLPSVAPAALPAVFGRCVHISQNVAGD